MRQFRMPSENTKNLSRFKKQIGSILRELKQFDEKEKSEALSYLHNSLDDNKASTSGTSRKVFRKKKSVKRSRFRNLVTSAKSQVVKARSYKCKECNFSDKSRKTVLLHLENHEGFPLTCLKCKKTFTNELIFEFHLKCDCKKRNQTHERPKFECKECPRKFISKQNLRKHIEGHIRNNCTYCDEVITKRKHLVEHLLVKHSIRLAKAIHKCNHCEKQYVKSRSLYCHLQQHFSGKFVCLECGDVCDSNEDFDIHTKNHDDEKRFKCVKCNEKFSRRQQYLFHLKRHNSYKCITCNETYASKLKMIFHKQKGHIVEGLVPKCVCPYCPKEFSLKSKLVHHLRKHADAKPNLVCQYCEKSFQSPYAYFKHCITVTHEKYSPEVSTFICESCGAQFQKKYQLELHNLRVHNNKKSIVMCQYCSYATKNKANMSRHVALHFTNEKQFTCEVCGKNFTNLASLKDHISYSHRQDRQFKCDECGKVFKRNSELVRHKGTHSDLRPHVCSICGHSYKRVTHLKRHEKMSHNLEPKTRLTQKLKLASDGTPVPIPVEKKQKQKESQSEVIDDQPATFNQVLTILEPINLVRLPDNSNAVFALTGNSTYAYETVNAPEIDIGANLGDDILDMSNSSEQPIVLNLGYNNEQLIRDYIGDNFQFADNNMLNNLFLAGQKGGDTLMDNFQL